VYLAQIINLSPPKNTHLLDLPITIRTEQISTISTQANSLNRSIMLTLILTDPLQSPIKPNKKLHYQPAIIPNELILQIMSQIHTSDIAISHFTIILKSAPIFYINLLQVPPLSSQKLEFRVLATSDRIYSTRVAILIHFN
jgi:hypothetical protein